MAKKQKETCPYCGKDFVYLSRHKCPKAPKEEKPKKKADEVIEKLAHYIEPKKRIPKESILSKIDIKSDKTLRFISKFINFENVNLTSPKLKKVIKDVFQSEITIYNFLNDDEAKIIEDCFELSKIDEFSKLDSEDIYKTISGSNYQEFSAHLEKSPD